MPPPQTPSSSYPYPNPFDAPSTFDTHSPRRDTPQRATKMNKHKFITPHLQKSAISATSATSATRSQTPRVSRPAPPSALGERGLNVDIIKADRGQDVDGNGNGDERQVKRVCAGLKTPGKGVESSAQYLPLPNILPDKTPYHTPYTTPFDADNSVLDTPWSGATGFRSTTTSRFRTQPQPTSQRISPFDEPDDIFSPPRAPISGLPTRLTDSSDVLGTPTKAGGAGNRARAKSTLKPILTLTVPPRVKRDPKLAGDADTNLDAEVDVRTPLTPTFGGRGVGMGAGKGKDGMEGLELGLRALGIGLGLGLSFGGVNEVRSERADDIERPPSGNVREIMGDEVLLRAPVLPSVERFESGSVEVEEVPNVEWEAYEFGW